MNKKETTKIILIFVFMIITLVVLCLNNSKFVNASVLDGITVLTGKSLYTKGPTLPTFNEYSGPIYCMNPDLLDASDMYGAKNRKYGVKEITEGTIFAVTSGSKAPSNKVTLTQIRMLKYILGVYCEDGEDISSKERTIEQQVACWYTMNPYYNMYSQVNDGNGSIYVYSSLYYKQWGYSSANELATKAQKIYDAAVEYADAMANYSTKEKKPTISKSDNATVESIGNNAYKVGPFTLDYLTESVKKITKIKVVGDDGTEFSLDSNPYMNASGTRSNTIPASGEKFYLIVKGINNTSEINIKVYSKYETYENIKLYRLQPLDKYGYPSFYYQSLVTGEGMVYKGEADSSVSVQNMCSYSIRLRKYLKDTNEEVVSGKSLDQTPQQNSDGTNKYTTAFDYKIKDTAGNVLKSGSGSFPNSIKNEINFNETQYIEVEEKNAPKGYNTLSVITLQVKCDNSGNITVTSYKNTNVSGTVVINNEGETKKYNGTTYIWDAGLYLYDIPITGEYKIKIVKQDGNTETKLSGAKFDVSTAGQYSNLLPTATNSKGETVSATIPLTSTSTQVIQIKEKTAPENYKLESSMVILHATVKLENNKYVLDTVKIGKNYTSLSNEKLGSVAIVGDTVVFTMNNYLEVQSSNYVINFEKRDTVFNDLINATFKVKTNGGTEKTIKTSSGKLSISGTSTTSNNDVITITETAVSDSTKYKILEEPITLTVKKKKIEQNGKEYYVADSLTIKGNGITNETLKFSYSLENGKMVARLSKTPTIYNETILKSTTYTLNLNKIDSKNSAKLQGASFRVKINGTTKGTYTTNANGVLSITNIPITSAGTDNIEITETKAPTNYEKSQGTLKIQITKAIDKTTFSYKVTSTKITQNFTGEVASVSNNNSTVNLSIKNKRQTIKLSGYVWEDEYTKSGKEEILTGKKDGNEKYVKGIKVILHTSDNSNILYTSSSTMQTTTNTNGYYEFEVPAGKRYYVEFVYNGQNYQHTKYYVDANGSKATETQTERDSLNKALETITPNKKVNGTTISNTINDKGAAYISDKCYTISAYTGSKGNVNKTYYSTTTNNINLGIVKRETADLAIRKDLYKAVITVKGETQEYMYNSRQLTTDDEGTQHWDISARQSDIYYSNGYTRNIKAADYYYTSSNEKLKIYVTYVIKVRNQSTVLDTKVNELVDYYDEDYTYIDAYMGDKNANGISSITISQQSKSSINGYKKMVVTGLNKSALKPGENMYIYITFSVGTGTNIKLDTDAGKGNLVEINSYSTYYGTNVHAPNSGNTKTYTEYKTGDVAGRIDLDSNPGNITSLDESKFEDDTDRAPYVKFQFAEEERIISGYVWEDERTVYDEESKAATGNGQREDGEQKVSGITVELWNADTNTKAKTLNGNVLDETNSTTTTDENGQYSFKGFLPGNYYVKFIYGNNASSKYNGQNYKSTTYKYEQVNPTFSLNNPDALGKYVETSTNYSDARDKYGSSTQQGTRAYVNAKYTVDIDYNMAKQLSQQVTQNAKMEAITGKILVNIEKVPTDTNSSATRVYKLENIDLGLQERPKAQLLLTKEVTNVNLVLANGTTLFDASGKMTNVLWQEGEKINSKWQNGLMTDLSNYQRTPQQIVLTMDQELMHGANIKINYKIVVENIGEADYASKQFYYTGKKLASEAPIKTKVYDIIDYIGYGSGENATRNNLKFEQNENTNWVILDSVENLVSEDAKEAAEEYETIIKYTFNKELLPTILDSGNNKVETTLVLSQVMSAQTDIDQAKYSNMAEILKVKNYIGRQMQHSTVGNQVPTEEAKEPDTGVIDVTIIPPFGKIIIIYTVILGALILTTIGIVLIKKKVLK